MHKSYIAPSAVQTLFDSAANAASKGQAQWFTAVRTLWCVEEHRVVAPVIPRIFVNLLPFVTAGIIIHWQEMNVRDPQLFQVIEAAFLAFRSFGARFNHSQIFAPIRNAGIGVDGKVADMHFILAPWLRILACR
jgi:hypothetical protein